MPVKTKPAPKAAKPRKPEQVRKTLEGMGLTKDQVAEAFGLPMPIKVDPRPDQSALIDELCKMFDVSQVGLAAIVGVSQRTIRHYVARKPVALPVAKLFRLLRDGKVTLDDVRNA